MPTAFLIGHAINPPTLARTRTHMTEDATQDRQTHGRSHPIDSEFSVVFIWSWWAANSWQTYTMDTYLMSVAAQMCRHQCQKEPQFRLISYHWSRHELKHEFNRNLM